MKRIISAVLSLLALSSSGAFAASGFKYVRTVEDDSNRVRFTYLTYEGAPILTISPEDRLVMELLWKIRAIGFQNQDQQLIDDASAALQYPNNFNNNYDLLCERLGYKSPSSSGMGQSLKTLGISLPARVVSIRNSQLTFIELNEKTKNVDKLSVITGLGCHSM